MARASNYITITANKLEITLDTVEAAKHLNLPALVAGAKEHVSELCHDLVHRIADHTDPTGAEDGNSRCKAAQEDVEVLIRWLETLWVDDGIDGPGEQVVATRKDIVPLLARCLVDYPMIPRLIERTPNLGADLFGHIGGKQKEGRVLTW